MVSKGLDFDHVSVVGILNADTMLNYPDFRAYERAFQLMASGGRACRAEEQTGKGGAANQEYRAFHYPSSDW